MKDLKKQSKIIELIPNMLTTLNLIMGIFAILLLIGDRSLATVRTSCTLIFIGIAADVLDGKAARYFNVESELGKQLDSFADSITFGFAPIAVLYSLLSLQKTQEIFIIIAFVAYPLAGIFRLARYNLGDFKDHFMGLPITAAGAVTALYGFYLSYSLYTFSVDLAPFTAILLLLLSGFMVSTVKVPRMGTFFKSIGKKNRIPHF